MRVKMLITRVGAKTFDAGKEYDLPDARAERWIASGWCAALSENATVQPSSKIAIEESPTEFAVTEHVMETTVKRGRRR